MTPTPRDEFGRWARLTRDVGFPIVVAVYFLVRLDYLLRANTEALQTVKAALDVLIAKH